MGTAKTNKTTAVATVESKNQLPAYLQGGGHLTGLEGLDSNDFVIPRVMLLQGTSEQVETFEAAKSGDFWLNVLDIPLGKNVTFTPLLNRKRYMLLAPMEDGKGVLARADDAKTWNTLGKWSIKMKGVREPIIWEIDDYDVKRSGLAEFGTANPDDPKSPPAATIFYDYLVLLHGVPEIEGTPVLISLARSSARKARDLNGKIGFINAPMQSRKFDARPVKDSNPDGQDYWNWQFEGAGWVEEDFFNSAKAAADRFSTMNFRGAQDEDTGEGRSETADPAAGGDKEF